MTKGFVFGKFLPFHKGHEAMIRFARAACDHLTILVCCSNTELISPAIRKSWISSTLADLTALDIRIYSYNEEQLANTSVASETVSAAWAEVFSSLLPNVTLLVTSEPYGEYVAGFMGIRHLPFNPDRSEVPVAASLIRNNLPAYWSYLPPAVKATLALKVVLLGTESTGKSTLTDKLAAYFHGTAVQEAARDIIPDSNEFTVKDLYTVANVHAARIDAAVQGDSPLIFIDTDVYITISYGLHFYDTRLDLAASVFDSNRADLYLYLNNDVPYYQDGTRLEQSERDELDAAHRRILKEHNIFYREISGSWEERLQVAIALVSTAYARKKRTFFGE
ncbi:AAA family ATPase [Chitinophaga sp. sic0106]|nr:AAA family ATPase [Chitinophaga sp. sic0106]MBV7530274.1 AAA family ATPase [Chitinophaga sp. sic0106]